ncbi:MAG: DUF542 domain-containing protein, partial [Acidimicrobiales bacterium]|nr:DUF542 domain-containing protein [Acidimicrobiales bacterium]
MTETETGPSIDTALGDLALLPGATRVLEDHALDFCCRGGRSLREACAEQGIDATAILEQLRAARSGPAPDWTTLDAGGLVDHVLEHHHAYLRDELPRLEALAHKVRSVHGGLHPELIEVEALVRDLRHDLEPHLDKEERVLFPAIA